MQVNVKDRLSGITAVVDDETVAFFFQTFIPCDRLSDQKKTSNVYRIFVFHAMDIVKVILGDDQDMDGRLRIDVLECNGCRILKYDGGGDLLLDDPAKKTALGICLVHLSPIFEKLLKKQLRDPVWQAGPVWSTLISSVS